MSEIVSHWQSEDLDLEKNLYYFFGFEEKKNLIRPSLNGSLYMSVNVSVVVVCSSGGHSLRLGMSSNLTLV